ncbi:S-adenosylmethionine sensor upstream of mTORC1 isoform 2-T2 [Syngnathus typhle]
MDPSDDVGTERHRASFCVPIPDASSAKNEQEKLSGVVKNVHRKLRRKYREVGDFDKIWREHCEDEQTLSEYAVAMKNLADNHWAVNCEKEGRIDWCHSVCQEYFRDGGMKRMLEKDEKSASFSAGSTEAPASGRPSSSIQSPGGAHVGKIRLLDVGSCFNPFKKFDGFLTVGIDIVPAVESVYKCDFLNLQLQRPLQLTGEAVEAFLRHLHSPIDALPGRLFHVVVFSLLLSYFPSPYQRWICCKKAHELLELHGLLLIITPDSSHQNRHALMMRSWRVAVESLGFKRYKTSTLPRRTRAARRRPAPTWTTSSWLGPSPSCPTPVTRIPARARAARCPASRSWRTPSCSRPRPPHTLVALQLLRCQT